MPQHEMEERADLLRRVRYSLYDDYYDYIVSMQVEAMYSADPPVHPDLEFFREAFHILVKYQDRCVIAMRIIRK